MNISSATPEYDQRAVRLVDDHLVDDHLGEQRRRQADELDRQAGDQHVAPDALVLEEFGEEPANGKRYSALRLPRSQMTSSCLTPSTRDMIVMLPFRPSCESRVSDSRISLLPRSGGVRGEGKR
jgi:hypothetical protein